MLLLDEGPHALVGDEDLAAEEEVEVVDPVDAEAVALDARDRLAARRLGVCEHGARVVERVDDVDAEAQRDVRRRRRRPAQVGRGDAAELGARAAAVEADRAGAVDEPELREERRGGCTSPTGAMYLMPRSVSPSTWRSAGPVRRVAVGDGADRRRSRRRCRRRCLTSDAPSESVPPVWLSESVVSGRAAVGVRARELVACRGSPP